MHNTSTMVLTVAATKGGVGKTTIAANLAALLADLSHRVLLLDLDHQPSLSNYFLPAQRQGERPKGLLELVTEGQLSGDVIHDTPIDNLDIVISNDYDQEIPALIQRHFFHDIFRIRTALDECRHEDLYDYVVIDSQGAEGELQSLAVAAADTILTPMEPTRLSAEEFFRGTLGMLTRMATHPRLRHVPARAVINRATRTRDARDAAAIIAEELESYIRNHFREAKGRLALCRTIIPDSKAFREAGTHNQPVHRHEPRRTGPMSSGSAVMHHLAWELFPYLEGQAVTGSDAIERWQERQSA